MKEIVTTFSPNGGVQIETHGFKGTACQDATRNLEAALGDVLKAEATDEMYQVETQAEKARE